jgi:hypothetical protein
MPGFEPGNPAYAKRVQSSFDRQQVMTLLQTLMTMHGRPDP